MAFLTSCIALWAVILQGSPSGSLVPASSLLHLRSLAGDVAKLGDAELLERMRAVLTALGDDPKALEKLGQGWEKSLGAARKGKNDRDALAKNLEKGVAELGKSLAALEDERRSLLAAQILALDCEDDAANEAVGNVKADDGTWFTKERADWRKGAQDVARLLSASTRLSVSIHHQASDSPVIRSLAGSGNQVSAHGIQIDSVLDFAVLDRVLTQALRALALSNALLYGDAVIPGSLKPASYVILGSNTYRKAAIDDALAHGTTFDGKKQLDPAEMQRWASFHDARGWRTLFFCFEADYCAWIVRDAFDDYAGDRWSGADVQPSLRVGLLNWIDLSVLGTSYPLVFAEPPKGASSADRTVSQRSDALSSDLFRCAGRSTYGCRAWMIRQVLAGKDPPWANTLVNQEGKIQDELLLKTTLVCQMLQEEGVLFRLMKETSGKAERVPAFERALSMKLPELESRWKRWLLPDAARGVLQELRKKPPASAPSWGDGLAELARVRALALAQQPDVVEKLEVDPELSQAAARHATYLAKNPEQKTRWPDLHEEFVDHAGFTVEGATAGSRSVIHFALTPAQAVDSWMGTFYHRLPLLNPGLFGVGVAADEGVVVLDVASLVAPVRHSHVVVWPVPDARDVPRGFEPELPNPVPDEDLSQMGFPITVQLFFEVQENHETLDMTLVEGGSGSPREVDAVLLSPDEPRFAELAPENAWCLIPKKKLAAETVYTVSAKWTSGEKTWSFTTGN